jgi:TPR repeat protein
VRFLFEREDERRQCVRAAIAAVVMGLVAAAGPLAAAVPQRTAEAGCYRPAQAFLSFAVKELVHMGALTGIRLGQLKADSLNGCELLAKQGDRRSQSYMGLIAHTPDQAFFWMEKAAEQGDMPSIERMHTFAGTPAEKLRWAMIYRARIKDWPRIRQDDEAPVTPMQQRWAESAIAEASGQLTPAETSRVGRDVRNWLRAHPARR